MSLFREGPGGRRGRRGSCHQGEDEKLTRASQWHIYQCVTMMKLVNMVEFLQLKPWCPVVGTGLLVLFVCFDHVWVSFRPLCLVLRFCP